VIAFVISHHALRVVANSHPVFTLAHREWNFPFPVGSCRAKLNAKKESQAHTVSYRVHCERFMTSPKTTTGQCKSESKRESPIGEIRLQIEVLEAALEVHEYLRRDYWQVPLLIFPASQSNRQGTLCLAVSNAQELASMLFAALEQSSAVLQP